MRTRDYDKQQRIKEAMVHLILREGINGASVSKIAREAGVSPATIYIYYESKEDLLSAAFREYAHQSYQYLGRQIRPGMGAAELIEAIVRGYYAYTVEHEEIFSFVEQCAHCPTLAEYVSQQECCCGIFDLMHQYQARGLLRRCSDANLAAVLFAPVRFLAMNRKSGPAEPQLRELVAMLQRLLLP
jgi:AcrR family transcriptional regulator